MIKQPILGTFNFLKTVIRIKLFWVHLLLGQVYIFEISKKFQILYTHIDSFEEKKFGFHLATFSPFFEAL
jgi:hypothetical protein